MSSITIATITALIFALGAFGGGLCSTMYWKGKFEGLRDELDRLKN